MIRKITLILAIFCLSSCGSFVPVVKLDELPTQQKNQLQSIKIYDSSQLQGKKYEVLNFVEGNSCKNKMWDPAATRSAAVDQVKYQALEMGGNGIRNIQCGNREGTSTNTNCWELISCTAEAIKVIE